MNEDKYVLVKREDNNLLFKKISELTEDLNEAHLFTREESEEHDRMYFVKYSAVQEHIKNLINQDA